MDPSAAPQDDKLPQDGFFCHPERSEGSIWILRLRLRMTCSPQDDKLPQDDMLASG